MTPAQRAIEAKALAKALSSPELVASVIRLAAVMESRLDSYLALEFGGRGRFDEFSEFIAPTLSLPLKLRILKNLKFHRPMKSVSNIVDSLERLRVIRNKLAHEWYFDEKQIKAFQSDRTLVTFLLGYPKSFSREKHLLEVSFSRLWHSYLTRHGLYRDTTA
ncbi:hypothetical protein EGT07_18870 [Herbaspirillum sp. HC18]|nr:hypothetical protein EGT07_18870 [Herbaspirillum sp. HC18]